MPLEGNAEDFGLSEIFQLISIQKKSGMLSVSGEDNNVIFFDEGIIISTRDRRNKTRDPLKDYLLRYGFLDRDEMNRIQQIQAESRLDLTDILLSEKYFSEDELKTIFCEQIQETIQNIVSWPKSYYKFISGKQIIRGIRSFATLKVDNLLMESMRRIDEFPELQKIFKSRNTIVRRLSPSDNKLHELDKYEEVIYELLVSSISVDSLVGQAKMPRFCTYEALKNLLEKGLLEIIEEEKSLQEIQSGEEKKEQIKNKKRLLPAIAAIFILTACFAIGNYVIPILLPPGLDPICTTLLETPVDNTNIIALKSNQFKARWIMSSIEEGLEEYLATKGSYPFTLEILAARKFVNEKTLKKAHMLGITYAIKKGGNSYTLKRI